jgi:hypothetical protein
MRGLRIVIMILVLASLVTVGNAQETSYAGAAKIVLEIININTCPYSSYSSQWYPSYYTVLALYSSDPSIKQGSEYSLQINEDETGYWGFATGVTPSQFVDGTIIGINNYYFNNSMITVEVAADPTNQTAWNSAWQQQITILGTANADTSNPTVDTNTGTSTSSIPSIFSSMPSIDTGSNLFNMFSENSLMGYAELQAPSTPFGNSITSGENQPFSIFSNPLNAFPSLGIGTLLTWEG